MRVLHAPANVGNQPWVLSRAERALGVNSDLIVNYSTWLDYPADRVLGDVCVGGRRDRLRRARYGFGVPFRHDVLHHYFGPTLLHMNGWPPGCGRNIADSERTRADNEWRKPGKPYDGLAPGPKPS